ncbi:MAG: recombinase family protein [Cyanobacteria bacterium REEB65]|nr:recombinase family protein [Cyanobacteria bacterium REEB65]
MKAIGYIRVSTQEQASEGVSLAAQERKLRAYAELYDVVLVDVIADAGVSAKTLDRSGLQVALEKLEAGEADGILVAKLDRLTRSVKDLGTLTERYFGEKAGSRLMAVDDQIDTKSAGGRLVLNVLASVSQWEREVIGERTATALAEIKRQGGHVGREAYGFEMRDGRLVVNEAEAAVAARVEEMRASGMTLQAIADVLNSEAIPTKRGGKWAPSTVRNILQAACR